METALHNELALIFIENIQRDFSNDRRYYIIDKDKCEVYWLPVWKPVLNADDGSSFLNLRFENDVKEYGFQAAASVLCLRCWFENDVKEYGFQAETSGV